MEKYIKRVYVQNRYYIRECYVSSLTLERPFVDLVEKIIRHLVILVSYFSNSRSRHKRLSNVTQTVSEKIRTV